MINAIEDSSELRTLSGTSSTFFTKLTCSPKFFNVVTIGSSDVIASPNMQSEFTPPIFGAPVDAEDSSIISMSLGKY
jgi:hypothetical protein